MAHAKQGDAVLLLVDSCIWRGIFLVRSCFHLSICKEGNEYPPSFTFSLFWEEVAISVCQGLNVSDIL
jgi:hypothetical protein